MQAISPSFQSLPSCISLWIYRVSPIAIAPHSS
jgi:hypothetical protein